jgi:hypothetical protein
VGLLAGDEEPGGVGVAVQRIGRHHGPGQLQPGQQRLEGGDLTGGAVDLALSEHGATGMVHRGQQMDPPAVLPGARQRLAVDRDSTPTLMLVGTVPVGKPGADHRRQQGRVEAAQGPADRGLGRDHPVVGGLAAGAERGTDLRRNANDDDAVT